MKERQKIESKAERGEVQGEENEGEEGPELMFYPSCFFV